jgi:hypothetical protein
LISSWLPRTHGNPALLQRLDHRLVVRSAVDQVAEAHDLIAALAIDIRERRDEAGVVAMDVRDDRGARRQRRAARRDPARQALFLRMRCSIFEPDDPLQRSRQSARPDREPARPPLIPAPPVLLHGRQRRCRSSAMAVLPQLPFYAGARVSSIRDASTNGNDREPAPYARAGPLQALQPRAGQCRPAPGRIRPHWSSCIPPKAAIAAPRPTAGSPRSPAGATARIGVVPIALHVDYWDYIGWKDPYAKALFSSRQRRLAQVMRAKIVYTPQVLLQGEDFRRWQRPAFDEAVAKINARPVRARIDLSLEGSGGAFPCRGSRWRSWRPSQRADAGLYLAAYENKLVSASRGGRKPRQDLMHDYVAFEWVGPLAVRPGRAAQRPQGPPLLPRRSPRTRGDRFRPEPRHAEVLQALMLPACP